MPVNGVAVASVAVGSIFVWSGLKGWNVTQTIGEVIKGQLPAGSEVNVLTAPGSGGSSGGPGTTNSAVANDALKYVGHGYTYGGAPGPNGTSNWDCSSFVNWVVGHDLKQSIPGYSNGTYNGAAHGPPTGSWGIWPGLKHVSTPQAGDIVVWVGHMGICTGPNQMISALNSKMGTLVTPIQGYGNGPLMCYGSLT
jgi:cell wall-associated NlpC family hydrolase